MTPDTTDPLIPVFTPALIVLLTAREREKGTALTEADVFEIRDNGHCVMLPESRAVELDEERGYNDLDPEQCWEQWLEFKRLNET